QDAGGVDQHVEAIQPSRQRVERLTVGDIDGWVGREIDDLNVCPGALQQSDARLADAGSSARDDDDSAIETVHAGHPIRLPRRPPYRPAPERVPTPTRAALEKGEN